MFVGPSNNNLNFICIFWIHHSRTKEVVMFSHWENVVRFGVFEIPPIVQKLPNQLALKEQIPCHSTQHSQLRSFDEARQLQYRRCGVKRSAAGQAILSP